jgi:ribonuclease BN (tRNA processing enzyme)
VQLGGHVVACSGDTEWTEALFELASGADLFACECFTCTRRVPHHLSFDVLREQLPAFGARRTLLTHLGPEMLGCGPQVQAFARERNIDVRCAHDDLVIEIPKYTINMVSEHRK